MTTARIAENVRETVLPRGAIVLSEELPHVPSVAIGIWVRAGSRDERDGEAGLTHFLEHMCFKGTARRDAKRIVEEIEAVGGQLDAATSREHTNFYARVLEEDFPLACDVLCDILAHSLDREEDVARERDVVLDEIRMYEDDPGDVAQERLMRALYGDHPLGRPVLGRPEVIRALDRRAVTAFRARRHAADRIVISAAGRVGHEDLLARMAPLLEGLPGAAESRPATPPGAGVRSEAAGREQEQTHLALGAHGLRANHPDRFVLWVLNNVLGGGASSRLFQEVRERRGLAYSIGSGADMFDDSGLLMIHTSCDPGKAGEAADVIGEILHELAGGGVSDREALRARDQLKGNLLLGMEGTTNRMVRMAGARMALGRVPPLDEVQRQVEAVTPDAVRALARTLLPPGRFAAVVLGPGAPKPISWAARA